MIKKIIKQILRYILPKSVHVYLSEKCKKREVNTLLNNGNNDLWLNENKNIHKGERCFILATGPSLDKVDLSKLKNEYTIGVNGIYKIAKEIDLNYFIYVSEWYWKENKEGIQNLNCDRKFLPLENKEYLQSPYATSWINILRPRYYSKFGYPQKVPYFFSEKPNEFFTAGGSVIFLSLQLAYYLGFKEVVILGLDHSYDKNDSKYKKHGGDYCTTSAGDKSHFGVDYNSANIKYHVDLNAMERGYQMAKEVFAQNGRKIFNASPGSKLDIFDKIEYNNYIEK